MKKAFFLFPGQGAQYPGMALDLPEAGGSAVRELFTLASDISGRDMKALLGEGDAETLKRTDVSQPAITLANLAAAACLRERGVEPFGCAGFSLGEYAALAVAGIIGVEDCFLLAGERGKIMQAVVDRLRAGGEPPGMAAVMGLAPEQVESLIAAWRQEGGPTDLYAANFNSPRQTVVSGTAAALAEGTRRFTEAGARRVIPLAVAGPFHSPLMGGAAEAFRPVLEKVPFKDPRIPFYSNVSGKAEASGEEIKALTLAHISSPVRWTGEEAAIQAAGGFDACLEAGPGKVLQGLWKDTGSSVPCFGAGTAEAIHEAVSKLENESWN
jgi:[acyl-carrier-protein] S-malonyltransferase